VTSTQGRSLDGASWDALLGGEDGDLLQSWLWGEFKGRHGWATELVLVDNDTGTAMAQILFRKRGPFTVAYMPRGPVVGPDDALAADLLRRIDAACARHRSVLLVIEPHKPLPPSWLNMDGAFAPGPASFQTSRTVKVDLVDDAALLAQMRKDTRYNITYAQRKGVSIERAVANPTNLDVFYRLLGETAERNGFGIHARAYYEDFLACFGDRAVLLFSHAQGVVTAGLIAARFGNEARSMYAGSAGAHRGRGDSALLRFAAMQWARELGCLRYDLGGIAPAARSGSAGVVPGSSLEGVDTFKTGFGGTIVSYPQPVERRYRPRIAWLIRHVNARFRTAADGALPTETQSS